MWIRARNIHLAATHNRFVCVCVCVYVHVRIRICMHRHIPAYVCVACEIPHAEYLPGPTSDVWTPRSDARIVRSAPQWPIRINPSEKSEKRNGSLSHSSVTEIAVDTYGTCLLRFIITAERKNTLRFYLLLCNIRRCYN